MTPCSSGGSGDRSGVPLQVLHDQLADVVAREGPLAGEQFLVDDGQAVLVAEAADPAVERLRGGVDGRDAAGDRGRHALPGP